MLSLPPVHVIVLIVAIKAVFLSDLGPQIMDRPAVLTGLVPFALGLYLLIAARRAFRRARTTVMTFDNPDRLVTAGPFAFSRNPMYLGFVLVLLGIALLAGYAVGFLAPLIFFLLASFWYIPFEERAAARAFGADYASYRARTRRWI